MVKSLCLFFDGASQEVAEQVRNVIWTTVGGVPQAQSPGSGARIPADHPAGSAPSPGQGDHTGFEFTGSVDQRTCAASWPTTSRSTEEATQAEKSNTCGSSSQEGLAAGAGAGPSQDTESWPSSLANVGPSALTGSSPVVATPAAVDAQVQTEPSHVDEVATGADSARLGPQLGLQFGTAVSEETAKDLRRVEPECFDLTLGDQAVELAEAATTREAVAVEIAKLPLDVVAATALLKPSQGGGGLKVAPGNEENFSREPAVEVPQVQTGETVFPMPQIQIQEEVRQVPRMMPQEVTCAFPAPHDQAAPAAWAARSMDEDGSAALPLPSMLLAETTEEDEFDPPPKLSRKQQRRKFRLAAKAAKEAEEERLAAEAKASANFEVVKQAPQAQTLESIKQVSVPQVQTVEEAAAFPQVQAIEKTFPVPQMSVHPVVVEPLAAEAAEPAEERGPVLPNQDPNKVASAATKGRGKSKDKGKGKQSDTATRSQYLEVLELIIAQTRMGQLSQDAAIAATEDAMRKFGQDQD